MKKTYEAPVLVVEGTLADLTAGNSGGCDPDNNLPHDGQTGFNSSVKCS